MIFSVTTAAKVTTKKGHGSSWCKKKDAQCLDSAMASDSGWSHPSRSRQWALLCPWNHGRHRGPPWQQTYIFSLSRRPQWLQHEAQGWHKAPNRLSNHSNRNCCHPLMSIGMSTPLNFRKIHEMKYDAAKKNPNG